jgi:hypothetical protein
MKKSYRTNVANLATVAPKLKVSRQALRTLTITNLEAVVGGGISDPDGGECNTIPK